MKEYAEILRAIADGRDVQWRGADLGWYAQPPEKTLREVCNGQFPPEHYRVKPNSININGYEVPEPLRVAPEEGAAYWRVSVAEIQLVVNTTWNDDGYDRRWLARGLCHSTKEAAEQHASALLSFTTKE